MLSQQIYLGRHGAMELVFSLQHTAIADPKLKGK
jgi:hypothetical protein